MESRSLGRRKTTSQPSRTPQNGKVGRGLLKRKSQEKEIMKNEEGTNANVANTTLVLVPRKANKGNQW